MSEETEGPPQEEGAGDPEPVLAAESERVAEVAEAAEDGGTPVPPSDHPPSDDHDPDVAAAAEGETPPNNAAEDVLQEDNIPTPDGEEVVAAVSPEKPSDSKSSGSLVKTGSRGSVGKPGSGGSSPRKAGSLGSVKKTGGSGASTPRKTSSSQEVKKTSGSSASTPRKTSSSQEVKKTSGSGASTPRKTSSSQEVKKTSGSGASTPRKTSSTQEVKKTSGSGASTPKKASSSQEVKKTSDSGASTPNKASSSQEVKRTSGSGASTPKKASSSQEVEKTSDSGASTPKKASLSQEELAKSGSKASVKNVVSQDHVKKSGSGVSDKKPPSGTVSNTSVKKTSSQAGGEVIQKTVSISGSAKRTGSNDSKTDKSSHGGEERSASARTGTTGSQVTVSASRTSRRSRTSVRSQPQEEVWVPPEYNAEEFISGPQLSDNCFLSDDTLVFVQSFGYDCLKPDNLCLMDPKTAMFVSGNLVHFLDLENKSLSYMRSSTGGGIGHATVHPSYKYLAVAEKGNGPRIIVYQWPEREVYRVLRGGTEREYTYVAFNVGGELLCSQGGDPDYMLTVWNWETESTLLRCKAFSQDIYKVTFSSFHHGQLTSAGLGHIKLWKMAKTFTGLKLQGRLGRFGKTEISDINGFLQLPDGKVISGCEWGNILVWDDALIKVEITRRDGKPCHNGTIHKFHLEEGELISLGSDGWVRTWDFDTVDQAEASEEMNGKYALDPMNELHFAAGSNLVSMWPHPDPDMESIWFMQDGSGGIWKADLSFSMTTKGPERLYECPASAIRALVTCPAGALMAATGDDCHIAVFNYGNREMLVRSRFSAAGTTIMWLTTELCGKTGLLLAGFADGCIRLVELHTGVKKGTFGLSLVYVQKPHTAAITTMKQSPSGRMLVTASDDGIVWFFSLLIEEGKFIVAPLGFAYYGDPGETVTCLEFVPSSEKKFLLFTGTGRVVEMRTPGVKDLTDHTTYCIKGVRGRSWQFKTVKSEILREEARLAREAEKEKQRTDLQADIDERKKLGLEVDETTEKAKQEKRLTQEDRDIPEIPLVVPDPPSPVLVGVPAADGSFTLLMGGWDAGWVHTASFKEPRPAAVRVPGDEEVGISVRTISPDGKFLMLGMSDGRIRIHAIEEEDPWKLDNYWHLSMHDNTYGQVTAVCLSYDQRNVLTCGADGNIFLFDFVPPEGMAPQRSSKIALAGPPEERVDDIDDASTYSLEEQRQRSALDARQQLADSRKLAVKTELAELRREFKQWVVMNQGLSSQVALSHDDLLLDERIRAEQRRKAELDLQTALKEMEWDADRYRLGRAKLFDKFKGNMQYDRVVVRGFRNQREVSTFRVKKLSDSFWKARDETSTTVSHMDVNALSKAISSAVASRSRLALPTDPDANRFEQMSKAARRQTRRSVGIRAYRALLRLEEKRTKRRRRRTEWNKMMACRPDGKTDDPADLDAIQAAVDSLGDFKLKTAADFKVTDSRQNTTHLKRHQLISVKEQIHKHKVGFNERALAMRQRKKEVLRSVSAALSRATELQQQLPTSRHVQLPVQPQLAEDECPESVYEMSDSALAEYRKVAEAAAAVAHEDPAVVAAQAAAAAAAAAAAETPSDGTGTTTTPATTLRRRSLLRARLQGGPVETAVHRAKPVVQKSSTDQSLSKMTETRTVFARDRELKKMDELMEEFDDMVYDLWQEMVHIEYQLKNADLRLITRFRELQLVREFEKREATLNSTLQERMLEDAEGQLMLGEVAQRFEGHKREQEDLEFHLKELAKEVTSNVPGDKYAKFLLRVYKKKIKIKSDAKKDGDDDDSDSSSSLSDSDDDDESEDEDEDEEDAIQETWDLSACPPGCDEQLYSWVSEMRLRRGDLELELAGKRLAFEVAKKEYEAAQKKAKGTTAALQGISDDIHAFQLQKLARLNELEVAVSLQLSQLQMLQNQQLPADVSAGLVFMDSELERLAVRIDELYAETSEEKAKRRASYKEERRLKQDCRLMETYIEKLQKQSVAEMKKKFGRLVDLEELESLMVNETVEELRIRFEGEQCLVDAERVDSKERLSHLRGELILVIKDNTNRVGVIQMLKDEKRHLDKGLNFVRKAGIAPHDKRLDDALEIQNLMTTISLQKTQIMEMKQEIWTLSLKSKPYLDPCRHVSIAPGQESYDDLLMMGSQCSEDFLAHMGLDAVPDGPLGSGSQRGSGDSRAAPAGRSRSSTAALSGGAEVLPPAEAEPPSAAGSVGTETATGQEGTGGGTVAAEKQGPASDGGTSQTTDQSPGDGLIESEVPQSAVSADKADAGAAVEVPPAEAPPGDVTAEAPTTEGLDTGPDAGQTEQTPDTQVAPPDEGTPSAGESHDTAGTVNGSATIDNTSPEVQESPPDGQDAADAPAAESAAGDDAAGEVPAEGDGPTEGGAEAPAEQPPAEEESTGPAAAGEDDPPPATE